MNLLPDMYVSGFLNGCVMSYSADRDISLEDLPQHLVRETPERRNLFSIVQVLLSVNHIPAAAEIYGALETGQPPSKVRAVELYDEYVDPFYDDPIPLVKKALQGAILTHVLIADGEHLAKMLAEYADFELMEETVSEFGYSPTSLETTEIYNKLMRYAMSVLKEDPSE